LVLALGVFHVVQGINFVIKFFLLSSFIFFRDYFWMFYSGGAILPDCFLILGLTIILDHLLVSSGSAQSISFH
jgi:hypothetical protein